MNKARPENEIASISQGIYDALIEIGVPQDDLFQIFAKGGSEELFYSRNYLGIERTDAFLVIQIFFNQGRTLELKKKLFKGIADRLHLSVGIRKEDIFINLTEVAKENWSFGNGMAQYAE